MTKDLMLIKRRFLSNSMIDIHGPFYIKTSMEAYLTYLLLYKYNPIHYGEWITNFPRKNNSLVDYEIMIFEKLTTILGGKTADWVGSMNSGASEGNLQSLMMCKQWFQSNGYKKHLLAYTELTHQSIINAAKVLDFELLEISLTSNWKMDKEDLKKNLEKTSTRYGICVFSTLGYKKTGTSDGVQEISNVLKKYSSKRLAICVDAAMDGLAYIFSNKPFSLLKIHKVKTVTTSFHKLGGVAAPSGGIIYSKALLTENNYFTKGINETKTTLPAIAVWFTLFSYNNPEVLTKRMERARQIREYFIKRIVQEQKELKYYYDEKGISMLIVCSNRQQKLFEKLSTELPIKCNDFHGQYLVKLVFLPHFDKNGVDKLINCLE